MAPSSWPSSRWSRGSKPSAAKSRGVPTTSSTSKSSSPPSGASSDAGLGNARSRASNVSAASFWAASASLTCALSSLVWVSRACFSSPCALAMSLPTFFCSARTDSNAAMDDRRRSSAATRSSTSSVGSPRRRWAARSASGSSRSSRGSITASAYRPDEWPTRHDPLRWIDPAADRESESVVVRPAPRRAHPPGPVLLGDGRPGGRLGPARDPRRHRELGAAGSGRPGRLVGLRPRVRVGRAQVVRDLLCGRLVELDRRLRCSSSSPPTPGGGASDGSRPGSSSAACS